MKKVQVPVLVGAVGLIAAAAFVIVPLADDNNSTTPGISVSEPSGEPTTTGPVVSENEGFIRVEEESIDRKTPVNTPSNSASLQEKPAPRSASGGGNGGSESSGGSGGSDGGSNGVCDWDDGEWDCDDDVDDDDWDDDDDDDDDDD